MIQMLLDTDILIIYDKDGTGYRYMIQRLLDTDI